MARNMKKTTQKGLRGRSLTPYKASKDTTSDDEIRQAIRSYAKTANQRLRELEKRGLAKSSNAWRQAKEFAEADRSFMDVTGTGEIKFRTNLRKMTRTELQQELNELYTFIFRAKTSTVKGTREHYRKIKSYWSSDRAREDKRKEVREFFAGMSMEEFSEFWDYKSMALMIKRYGSDTVIQLIETSRDNPDLDMDRLDEVFTDILNEDRLSEKTLQRRVRDYRSSTSDEFMTLGDSDRDLPFE